MQDAVCMSVWAELFLTIRVLGLIAGAIVVIYLLIDSYHKL
jgi:hypothetical protein